LGAFFPYSVPVAPYSVPVAHASKVFLGDPYEPPDLAAGIINNNVSSSSSSKVFSSNVERSEINKRHIHHGFVRIPYTFPRHDK
jgi:hypothetical protein